MNSTLVCTSFVCDRHSPRENFRLPRHQKKLAENSLPPHHSRLMSSPYRGDVLTISNLQKHTVHAHETPRTKVTRYFNQFEDPRVLSHRDPSPIPSPLPRHQGPWDIAKPFFSGTPPKVSTTSYGRDVFKSNSGSKKDSPARGNSSPSVSTRVSI